MWLKHIIGFLTGGLPAEIVKQIGENVKAKGGRALEVFQQEIAFDLELVRAGNRDPFHARQIIALTFHFFMWGKLFITGSFPCDVIFTWDGNEMTIGFVYCLIITFYFPIRAIEKLKKML